MRKVLCIVLAFTICGLSICVYADDKTNLTTEQQQLQNQINESNANLGNVQNELSENLQQVQKLDEKILSSESEIGELNTKITDLQTSIDDVQEKLKDIEEKYNKQKNMLDQRLVSIYEAGEIEYLDVILSSKNLSDFLSSYFLITEMAEYDTQLLESVQEKKNTIDTEMEKLNKQKEELAITKQNQLKTATILQNTKTLRESYISKLSDEEKTIQQQIDEFTQRYAEINAQILELAKGSINPEYIGGELAWPVPGYTRITSEYGMRTHPITGVYKLHTGVDIGAPTGADFIAANDGLVTKAEYNSAYGNMVIIDHGGGVSTLYAHGDAILVQAGQTVKRGDTILKVGSTGYSTGAHAHFEVRLSGVTTNPLPYITNGLLPETQKQGSTNQTNN